MLITAETSIAASGDRIICTIPPAMRNEANHFRHAPDAAKRTRQQKDRLRACGDLSACKDDNGVRKIPMHSEHAVCGLRCQGRKA